MVRIGLNSLGPADDHRASEAQVSLPGHATLLSLMSLKIYAPLLNPKPKHDLTSVKWTKKSMGNLSFFRTSSNSVVRVRLPSKKATPDCPPSCPSRKLRLNVQLGLDASLPSRQMRPTWRTPHCDYLIAFVRTSCRAAIASD